MKKSKILATVLSATIALSAIGLTSCGQQGLTDEQKAEQQLSEELKMNDYRGGIQRTHALLDNVTEIVKKMKSNNEKIREDTPNNYWYKKGYLDFVSTFFDEPIINNTEWFTEEETKNWDETYKKITTAENDFTQGGNDGTTLKDGIIITRNEKDDYKINVEGDNWNEYAGDTEYRIFYDCNRDWCKAYSKMSFNESMPEITTQLFEYAQINENTYALQTSTERLLIKLEKAKKDTDIRDRKIKEFYYSRLSSDMQRKEFEPYKPQKEFRSSDNALQEQAVEKNKLMAQYPNVNEEGDLSTQYGTSETMFVKDEIKDINVDWVFEDKSLQQGILYKDNAMVVTSYNKLSNSYERFVFAAKSVKDELISDLENQCNVAFNAYIDADNKAENKDDEDEESSATDESTAE